MAAWRVPGEPFLFCLVRNATDRPVKYPAGCGLGWWEWTRVYARPAGSADFEPVPLIPALRPLSGLGPVEATLGPREEVRAGLVRHTWPPPGKAPWTFAIYVHEYAFPRTWEGDTELLVETCGLRSPVVVFPHKELLRQGPIEAGKPASPGEANR